MKGLDFLKKVSLAANEVVKPATARTNAAKDRNPVDADIRIFKDGSVYPSSALVSEFNLQYQRADIADKGVGFDVFKSTDYPNTQSWDKENHIIFIAAVSKSEPKISLFGSTKFDPETGDPGDVMTQGAATFGKVLLEDLKEVYGVEIAEGENYIDLVILRDTPFNTPDDIYFIPKSVSRGEDKGKSTLVRRENITLMPLVPKSWLSAEDVVEDNSKADDTKDVPKVSAKAAVPTEVAE